MKLAIFDCDGTLVDSQNIIASAMAEAFAGEGLEWPGRTATLAVVGLSLSEAMLALLPDCHPDRHARLAHGYREAFFRLRQDPAHREPLFDGGREAIEGLRARGDVILGMATGKSRRGVLTLLEREGLLDGFATIQTADDAPSKPDPAMVIRAMAEVGAKPHETVVIGDTVFDMQMALGAGAKALGVGWGYHPAAALTSAGAHRIAHHFRQVPGHLDWLWEAADDRQ
jgi:phosphoglycolate phosphatase